MTLNVSLTPHLEDFIHQTVSSGRYQSASEVVRTALRLLEEKEHKRAGLLAWLRQEIQKGLDSGPATALDMDEIKQIGRQRLSCKARAPQWPVLRGFPKPRKTSSKSGCGLPPTAPSRLTAILTSLKTRFACWLLLLPSVLCGLNWERTF